LSPSNRRHERLVAENRRAVDAMRQILHEHIVETRVAGRVVERIPRTARSMSDFATRPNSPSG
jgi:hypothetical protein